MFYCSIPTFQSFSEPLPLDYGFPMLYLASLCACPLGWPEWLQWAQVGYFPLPSGIARASWIFVFSSLHVEG